MTNRRVICWTLAVSALALTTAGMPADAGLDIDFGASVSIGNDADLFLSVSSRHFERDREEVDYWNGRYTDPDDLAVALFVSRRSGRSLGFIWKLRGQGLSWWELSARVGLSPDAWFPPVERAPGPPYGKAYGYWKKHGSKPTRAYALSDADARHLVAVRVLTEYYRVPVAVAMEWRASGAPLTDLVAREYRQRHKKEHATHESASHSKKSSKGKPGKRKK